MFVHQEMLKKKTLFVYAKCSGVLYFSFIAELLKCNQSELVMNVEQKYSEQH